MRAAVQTTGITELAARGRFKGYAPESEKAARKADVKESETLKQLETAWRKIRYDGHVDQLYSQCLEIIKDIDYSSKDVEAFSLLTLPELYEKTYNSENFVDWEFADITGLFLSALINNGKETDYTIYRERVEYPLCYLGHENTKNILVKGNGDASVGCAMKSGRIIVEGDVDALPGLVMEGGEIIVKGDCTAEGLGQGMKGGTITICGSVEYFGTIGLEMQNGSIIVKGNAGTEIGGNMMGGSITIEGNVGTKVGDYMYGGSITVKGNADYWVGSHMRGGEIHLLGDYESIADDIECGKIYHKGKLIVDISD